MTNQNVEYREIEGFPGYYVGNDGTVWSCRMQGGGKRDYIKLSSIPKQLTPDINKHGGHLVVTLQGENSSFRFPVHTLVLEAFVGPRPEGLVARHFPDRDPTNNNVSNLGWATTAENQADKITHGTSCRGEKCGMSKMTRENVIKLREMYSTGDYTQKQLGDLFGITQVNTSSIVRRKIWAHI